MVKVLQVLYVLVTCLPQVIAIVKRTLDLIEDKSSRGKVKKLSGALRKARKEKDTRELESLFAIKRSKPVALEFKVDLKQRGLLEAKKIYGINLANGKKKSYDVRIVQDLPKKKRTSEKLAVRLSLPITLKRLAKHAVDLTSERMKLLGEIKVQSHPHVLMMPGHIKCSTHGQRQDGTIVYGDAATISAGNVPFTAQMGRHGRMKSGIIPS